MKPITSVSEFYSLVKTNKHSLVMFTSESCGSCVRAKNYISELQNSPEYSSIPVLLIDVENPYLNSLVDITLLPTIESYNFSQVQVKDTIEGFVPDKIKKVMDKMK
jgi:thiol-disulfide isomerase/thioredoxin